VDRKVQPNVEHLTDSLTTMMVNDTLEGWLQLCLLAFEARNVAICKSESDSGYTWILPAIQMS
jgi:hypothetical protein